MFSLEIYDHNNSLLRFIYNLLCVMRGSGVLLEEVDRTQKTRKATNLFNFYSKQIDLIVDIHVKYYYYYYFMIWGNKNERQRTFLNLNYYIIE